MGYFKRKLDRGRSREQARRLHDESVDGGPPSVWEAIPDRPPARETYLRFSVPDRHEKTGARTGIFAAAYAKLRDDDLDPGLRAHLEAIVEWFEENLPVPRSVGDRRAIFLFKSTAGESTTRIWDLVFSLRSAGVEAEMQCVDRPGKILYEDDYQVAVLRWTKTGPR